MKKAILIFPLVTYSLLNNNYCTDNTVTKFRCYTDEINENATT